jgi:hypothetical protein
MIKEMKRKHHLLITLAIFMLAVAACTRNIDVKTTADTGQLVIEANLTNVMGPQFVKLSLNVPLTNTNTYPPVSGATVTITDPLGNVYPLTEGPAGTYSISRLSGVAGATYTLTVIVNGKTYTAKSTMPALVPIDSLGSQNLFVSSGNKKQIVVYYQDPANVVNQYRFVEYVNGAEADDIFVSDDEFNNGKYVGNILEQTDLNIYPGDTVIVEMQCIDKNMYTYWLTLQQENANNGQQSAAPSNPPTNITPATLGYFSAHTTQTQTIVVPQ